MGGYAENRRKCITLEKKKQQNTGKKDTAFAKKNLMAIAIGPSIVMIVKLFNKRFIKKIKARSYYDKNHPEKAKLRQKKRW